MFGTAARWLDVCCRRGVGCCCGSSFLRFAGFFFSLATGLCFFALTRFRGLAFLFSAQAILGRFDLNVFLGAVGFLSLALKQNLLAGFQFIDRDTQLFRRSDQARFKRVCFLGGRVIRRRGA